MNTVSTVPAFQYETIVLFGGRRPQKTKEIHIPSIKMSVNSLAGVFHADEPLNTCFDFATKSEVEFPKKEIQLSNELVEKIVAVVKLRLEVDTKEKEVISEAKQILE